MHGDLIVRVAMHAATTSTAYSPTFESTALEPPSLPLHPRALFGALAGLLGLGAAAALGAFDSIGALRLLPSVLLIEVGSLAMTAPTLLALHQFLGLRASVEDLAGALARALVRGGQVAAGLVVVVVGFAVTTDLAIPALLAALLAVGVFTTVVGCVELSAAERRAARRTPGLHSGEDVRFTLLLIGWVISSWAIAGRLGVHVATWVMGY